MMLRESAGLLVLVTLLPAYARDTSGSKDDSLTAYKRFLLDGNAVPADISLEQFASCYLTCTQLYGKLLETCCKSGLSAVCSNLPWDILKPKLGSCPGLLSPTSSAWLSLEQFAACFLTCVVGYEKLTEACCQTGLDVICTNLPWEMLKSQLGSCRYLLYGHSTSFQTIPTQTRTVTTRHTNSTTLMTSSIQPPTITTFQQPYWLPWESWICQQQLGACFQKRERNCSTGRDNDCFKSQGGNNYNVGLCTETACPDFFKTTTILPHTTPPRPQPTTIEKDSCQDDPSSIGCTIPDILTKVCKENAAAWKLCPRSCGLCDTCWDYLNCSSQGAQYVFCGRDEIAVQYCRRTCGKCDHKPVDVQLNKCGDPMTSEEICEQLQNEICICNEPDLRALCGRYCENKCEVYGYPYSGSNCKAAGRKKREAILNQVMFN